MEPGSFSDTVGVNVDPDLVRCHGFWWFGIQLKLAMWEKRKLDQETTRKGVAMIEVTAPSDDQLQVDPGPLRGSIFSVPLLLFFF